MTYPTFRSVIGKIVFGTKWSEDEKKYVVDEDVRNFLGIGMETNTWGEDCLSYADDVTVTSVQALADNVSDALVRASRHNANLVQEQEYREANITEAMGALGAIMREAAIAQGWCGEYEEYRKRIIDAVKYTLPVASVEALKNNSDRREEFTVTLTFRARDNYSANDFLYAMLGEDSDAALRHDVTYTDPVLSSSNEDTDTDE